MWSNQFKEFLRSFSYLLVLPNLKLFHKYKLHVILTKFSGKITWKFFLCLSMLKFGFLNLGLWDFSFVVWYWYFVFFLALLESGFWRVMFGWWENVGKIDVFSMWWIGESGTFDLELWDLWVVLCYWLTAFA